MQSFTDDKGERHSVRIGHSVFQIVGLNGFMRAPLRAPHNWTR